jgi:preprotein translocase subunit SecA
MHLQVVRREEAPPPDDVRNVSYSAADDPVQGSGSLRAAAAAAPMTEDGASPEPEPEVNVPLVKTAEEKVGRNDPCWCGSGKKYKFCHGR